MNKLTLKDVQILGEGPQIRNAILKKYKNVTEFFNKNITTMALSTFRYYLCQDVITAANFKYAVTLAFNTDYTSLHLSKPQQVKNHVQSIYDNIKKYSEEEDRKTMDYLLEWCKAESLTVYTAMIYRAKARNFYYTNTISRCQQFYEYAIQALPEYEINKRVFFYCELADDLLCENMLDPAEKLYKDIDTYVAEHKHRLDNNTLFYYYYYRSTMYMTIGKNATAKDFFVEAFKYASRNYEKAGAISNIGLSYKKIGNFREALKFYHKALKFYDEMNLLPTGTAYNNIAMVHKTIGEYFNAEAYIKKALDIAERANNLSKKLIFTHTYVEIQMEMGNEEGYKCYFDVLLSTKHKQIYNKPDILNDIESFIEYMDNIHCLNELNNIIIELIDAASSDGYKDGLIGCLGHISLKINRLTKGVAQ